MTFTQVTLSSPAATERLGVFLAGILRAGDVVALNGPLGAGKSALARAIIAFHNPDEIDIPSPTFTLVQSYAMRDSTPLLHFDMYRLEAPEDALELGIEDSFYDSVNLVEWPDRIGPFLPKRALICDIRINPDESRTVVFSGNAQWKDRLGNIPEF